MIGTKTSADRRFLTIARVFFLLVASAAPIGYSTEHLTLGWALLIMALGMGADAALTVWESRRFPES